MATDQQRYVPLPEPVLRPDYSGLDDIGSSLITLTVCLGIYREYIKTILDYVNSSKVIAVVGLFSHLVDSGNLNAGVNREQEEQFTRAIEIATDELGYRPECHLANSGGTLNMPHLHLDSVRAGIITYGVCPPGEFNRDIGGRGGHPLCCD